MSLQYKNIHILLLIVLVLEIVFIPQIKELGEVLIGNSRSNYTVTEGGKTNNPSDRRKTAPEIRKYVRENILILDNNLLLSSEKLGRFPLISLVEEIYTVPTLDDITHQLALLGVSQDTRPFIWSITSSSVLNKC